MADLNKSSTQFLSHLLTAELSAVTPTAKPEKGKSGVEPNLYNLLFFLLVKAMDIQQKTVELKSKELSSNAAIQEELNKEDKALQYKQIPEGASQAEINRIQDYNLSISARRDNDQNELITTRQNAQVTMTLTNSDVDYVEQDASMDTGWLKTLMSIFQVITQISSRN